jgi:HEAT repeat protein
MFKSRSRLITFLFSLSLMVLLSLPLAAKEKAKLKPELWQIDGIVAALGDERDGVGLRVIRRLAEFDQQQIKSVATLKQVQTLVAIFKDKKLDLKVRLQAIQSLGSLGNVAQSYVNNILDILKDDRIDVSVRVSAAEALGKLGDSAQPSHVKDVLSFLKNDKIDASVQGRTAEALGKMGNAVEPYVKDIVVTPNFRTES